MRVQIEVVVVHLALVGWPKAGQRVDEGRLPRATRPDDGEERALAQRERHVIEQHRVVVAIDGQPDCREGDLAGIDIRLQHATHETEGVVADGDDVPLGQLLLANPLAINERAVLAAEVGEGNDPLVLADLQHRVLARSQQVVDDDVVVRPAPDAHRLPRQIQHPGELPEVPLVDCPRPASINATHAGSTWTGRIRWQ